MSQEDLTEATRMKLVAEINGKPQARVAIELKHGQAWDTHELQRDFEVEGFMAPFVIVVRKKDQARGLLTFQHYPRFYWGFQPESKE